MFVQLIEMYYLQSLGQDDPLGKNTMTNYFITAVKPSKAKLKLLPLFIDSLTVGQCLFFLKGNFS